MKTYLLLFHLAFFLAAFSQERMKPNLFIIESEDKFGFIDTLGNVIVTPQYEGIQPYARNGIFWVKKYNPEKKKKVYLLVNSMSQLVSRDTFENVNKSFRLDRWVFKKSTGWGVLDASGKELIPFEYDKIKIEDNEVVCAEKKGISGYFTEPNLNNFMPLPKQDKYIYNYIGEGYYSVYDKQSKLYGIFDTKINGNKLESNYTKIERVRFGQVVLGKTKEGVGIYDLNREEYIVKSGDYIDIWLPKFPKFNFVDEDSLFIATNVSDSGSLECHVIDYCGKSSKIKGDLADQYFIKGKGFTCGIASFRFFTNNLVYCGGVNADGKLIIPAKFNQIGPSSEGMIRVNEGNLFGFWSSNGIEKIPSVFVEARAFINGISYVKKQIVQKGKTIVEEGYIDINGNFIWKKT